MHFLCLLCILGQTKPTINEGQVRRENGFRDQRVKTTNDLSHAVWVVSSFGENQHDPMRNNYAEERGNHNTAHFTQK